MADFDLSVAPGFVASTQRRQVADWTIPGVYAADGYAIDPAELRMGKIFAIFFATPSTQVGGVNYLYVFDQQTGKIALVDAATGAEAAGGTVFTGTVVRLEAVGQ